MHCPACGHTREREPASSKAWWLQHSLFKLPPTRDVSSIQHHADLPEWLNDLGSAVKAAWHKRVVRYPVTAVLLLSWRDTDMAFAGKEIKRLQSVLEDGYGCEVDEWKIPSRDADLETLDKVRSFLDQYGQPDNLVIVYYAGHGRPGTNPGSPPLWFARESSEDGEELDTGAIQQLLTRAREQSPDVLLLHDCCHPLSAHTSNQRESRAVVECIFAGGFESRVPISGPDSFTRALTEELSVAESNGEVISVVELHRRLICRLVNWQPRPLFDENDQLRKDKQGKTILTIESRVTPCHLFLSKRDRTIHLAPKSHSDKGKQRTEKGRNPQDMSSANSCWPKALIAIRLVDNPNNTSDLKPWLLSAPAEVVDFVGILPSFSSLLLLALPIPVWDMLPDSDAVSFIGFTTDPVPRGRGQGMTAADNLADETAAAQGVPCASLGEEPACSRDAFQLLRPINQEQATVLNILDAMDKILPMSMRLWKKVRGDADTPAAQWFFDQMRHTFREQPDVYPDISEEDMMQHKDLLFRYLDARELLECDSALLNISGRFQSLMGPVYNWRNFDEFDVDKASRLSSSEDRSAFWSFYSSGYSVAESAPSSHGDVPLPAIGKKYSPSTIRSGQPGRWLQTPRIDQQSGHEPENSATTIGPRKDQVTYGAPRDQAATTTSRNVFPAYSNQDSAYGLSDDIEFHTGHYSWDRGYIPSTYADTKTDAATGSVRIPPESSLDSTDQDNLPTPRPETHQIPQTPGALETGAEWETRDPRYRIEPSYKFQPGEVFKIMWSEPQTAKHSRSESRGPEMSDRLGAAFNVGFRRFMVIANDQGHSTCVPILTYSGKGCLKRGCKPAKHGIAYETGKKAHRIDGEPRLGFNPVQITFNADGERLPKEARINYSKLTTIEHNVEVFFVGSVSSGDWNIVADAVNTCWDVKDHDMRRR